MASFRKKRSLIKKLKNDDEQWLNCESGLLAVLIQYFKKFFHSASGDMQAVLDCMDIKVTAEHNDALLRPYTSEEVKQALLSMYPDKSLGPNGLTSRFTGFFGIFLDRL